MTEIIEKMTSTNITKLSDNDIMNSREKWALTLLCVTQFMLVLDGVIMNVAIAKIQESLDLTPLGLQWVINAYVLAYGGFLLLGGRVADLFGKRRVLLVGISLFTLASLIGGLSQNGMVLIFERALQGLGGAFASPASMSLLAELFAAGRKRDRAFGAMGAIAAAGAASGVLLGGLLTEIFGWASVLLINVPIGVSLCIAVRLVLPTSLSSHKSQTLDLAGSLSITAALVMTVLAIVSAPVVGWTSFQTLGSLFASLCLFYTFIRIEQRAKHPLLRFSMLRNRRFLASMITALAHATGPMTTMYFLSLHLQKNLGYSPLQTGLAFLPMPIMAAIGAMLASRTVGRYGTAPVMVAGLGTMAIGLAFIATLPTGGSYVLNLLPGIMIVGISITLTAVPMTITALSSVAAQDTGLASGLLHTCQQIGAALTLSLLVAITFMVVSFSSGSTTDVAQTRLAFIAASSVSIIAAILVWVIAPGATLAQDRTT
jgi:EmrB/QacA subfamily drug resistance transporter